MSTFKSVIGGLSLYMACFAAVAAEPTFTPRPPPTALAPTGKNAAADLPPPRAPAPPAPINAGTLGLPPALPPAQIIVAPPALPAPLPPAPAQTTPTKPALSPKPAVLKETLVRAAPIDNVRAAPIDNVRAAPVKEPARIKPAKQPAADRRMPAADFSAWEKSCLLPEDLPPLKSPVKIGAQAQARVDVFIRRRPSCQASILDVLATGETVRVEGKSDGWWRVRNRRWGSFWVGERLLAPMQQR
jgi:hypothetical protein